MTRLLADDIAQARHLGEEAHRRGRDWTKNPYGPEVVQLQAAWARGWWSRADALDAGHLGGPPPSPRASA